MNILLNYGYHPRDMGVYFEKAMNKDHTITYCGPAYKFERSGFLKDLDLSMIEKKWDLFFYLDSYHPGFPQSIERLPFPTACYLLDIPYGVKQRLVVAPFFDYVFTPHKEYLETLQQVNENVFWLPFACDPEVHRRHKVEKVYEVAFAGGNPPGSMRRKILDKLARYFKMNDYTRYYMPEEWALIYSQAKIIFNKSWTKELNMRPFEALSCDSLLLTEKSSNGWDDLFVDGKHFVSYSSEDELFEKIRYYLTHDEEREKIAEAGHKLALEKHTYWHRVQTMLQIIKDHNYKINAPMRSKSKGQIFLEYEKVYSHYIMIDSACELFAYSDVSFLYKLRALYYIFKTVFRRLRQMGWRNLFTGGKIK